MIKTLLITLLFALVSLPVVRSQGQDDESFNPKTVINKPFGAIKGVKTFPANADEVDVEDDELVIGIEIDGRSRAYPVNMLNGPYREIINDTIGDTPIATTW